MNKSKTNTDTGDRHARRSRNYLNPFRRFQLIFARHDYRSSASILEEHPSLLFTRRFTDKLTGSRGSMEYFPTTLPRQYAYTLITHSNIRN